jgi:hypothetical protein
MQYLHDKCIELNISINDEKLLIIYQLLYPQYINLNINKLDYIYPNMSEIIEDKENNIELNKEDKFEIFDNNIIFDDDITLESNWSVYYKPDIWLIKRSACKNLLTNHILTLEYTQLKKNCVKENKNDPTDKINISVGKKLRLSGIQTLNHFYKVVI